MTGWNHQSPDKFASMHFLMRQLITGLISSMVDIILINWHLPWYELISYYPLDRECHFGTSSRLVPIVPALFWALFGILSTQALYQFLRALSVVFASTIRSFGHSLLWKGRTWTHDCEGKPQQRTNRLTMFLTCRVLFIFVSVVLVSNNTW